MTQKENEAKVLNAIQSVVSDFGPDFAYPDSDREPEDNTCQYVVVENDGLRPSCLVGQVMHRLGYDLSELHEWEGEAARSVYAHFLGDDNDEARIDPVAWALSSAQEAQDGGSTWGEALELFTHTLASERRKA